MLAVFPRRARSSSLAILFLAFLFLIAPASHAQELDSDGDGIPDAQDNCPFFWNFDQADADGDGVGNMCDPDFEICWDIADNDGDEAVDCADSDCTGDFCCIDTDSDFWPDCFDNCPEFPNPGQDDSDGNFIGDACQDVDSDGFVDIDDNCVNDPNPDQADTDGDGPGNACDEEESLCNNGVSDDTDEMADCEDPDCATKQVCLPTPDSDGDGVPNVADNCPFDANADQADNDGEGAGNACDSSPDGSPPEDDSNIVDPEIGGGGSCGLTLNRPGESAALIGAILGIAIFFPGFISRVSLGVRQKANKEPPTTKV